MRTPNRTHLFPGTSYLFRYWEVESEELKMAGNGKKGEISQQQGDEEERDETAGAAAMLQGSWKQSQACGGDDTGRDKDVCGHCKKKVTSCGIGSDGLYCDYCEFWVHASCEGMSPDVYKLYSNIAQQVSNMSYYCSFNHCKLVSREILKHLGPIKQKVNENLQRIRILEKTVQKQEQDM